MELPVPDNDHDDRRGEAVDWFVRLDAGAFGQSELAAFRAWLARDPANEAAFDEICDLWGGLEPLRRAVAVPPPPRRKRRRLIAGAALAAAAILAFSAFDDLSMFWRADYWTGTEALSVTLSDGSGVELDARAAIALDFSGGTRRVTLLRGEAYFNVARDSTRAFSVEAAGGTTTARGTAFDIGTQEARTDVTVTEHKVSVTLGGEAIEVAAGEQTAYSPGFGALAPYRIDADAVTAWRRGQLVFHDKPLGDVIASLARRRRGYVMVLGEALRRRRVSGVISTADPLAAIRTIALSLGLRTFALTPYLVLVRN